MTMNTRLPFFHRIFCLTAGVTAASLIFTVPSHAQPITPANDGTGTQINQDGNQYNIEGGSLSGDGQNLFHSFEKFGLSEGEIANFLSNPDIRNILGRVVGGDVSIINGLIQVTGGTSNLFLINPAGMIFGPNASLNVPADFTVTTATAIEFGNNLFNVVGNPDYTSLIGNPSGYLFNVTTPGSIINEGNLTVETGQNLTLLGGTVVNTGTLSAMGGNLNVAAVTGEKLVRISQDGQVLNLEVSPLDENTGNPLPFTPLSLPQLLTHAETGNATTVTVNDDGQIELTGSSLQINPDSGTVVASGTLDATGTEENNGSVNILGDRITLITSEIAANGNILFQATDEITLDDGLSLNFAAGDGLITFEADTDNQGDGVFKMDGTQSITTSGRDLTISATEIQLGNLTTDGGDLVVDGAVNLTHDIELSTGTETGDITLDATVDGNQNLTLEAGEGVININEEIGGNAPLSSLEINTASQTNLSDGNITTNTGVIFNQTPVNLESNTTIDTSAENGNIQFNQSPISGNEQTLSLNAGTGNLDLDALGSEENELGGLSIESAGTVNLSGDIFTNGGLNFTNVTQVNLTDNVTLNTESDDGNINFTDVPIDGPGGLIMDVREGQVNLNTVGETTPLATFEVDGFGDAQTTLNGNITTDSGEIILGNSIILNSENITISTGEEVAGDIFIFDSVNQGIVETTNLTLTAGQGQVDFSLGDIGDVNPLTNLTIQGNQVDLGSITVQNNLDVTAETITSFFDVITAENDISLESQTSLEILRESELSAGNNLILKTAGTLRVSDSNLTAENLLKLESQENLKIQESQISSNGNSEILSESTVEIRDSIDNNFTIQANGDPENSNLLIQGNQGINIFTENNSSENPSQIQSSSDIRLVSDGIVAISDETVTLESSGNLFNAGGSFSILNLEGEPGNLSSNFQDTLIYAEGDIIFGDYIGLALKIETKGSITGGDITIIGANESLADTNPDDSDLEILSTSPALILRAGVTELETEQNIPSEAVGGTTFTVLDTVSELGTITVGNINTAVVSSDSFSEERGSIILEATGDITAQNITTASSDDFYAPEGRVKINSSNGDIQVGHIQTGGGILEISGHSITAEDINTFGSGRDSTDPNDSSVTLMATEGNIIVNTIQTGGNINIETPGLFQALGFIDFGDMPEAEFETDEDGFTDYRTDFLLKDRPDVIEYLVNLTDEEGNPYFTTEELENSEALVQIRTAEVFPASIVSLPPDNSNDNGVQPSQVQIKIQHGGQSLTDSNNSNTPIVISGNGEAFDFVVGPQIILIEGEEFVPNLNSFEPFDPSQFDPTDSFTLIELRRNETARPLMIPEEFPTNVSGTVGAIAIGNDRDNTAMYSSLRDIPLTSPPVEPPTEPIVTEPPTEPPTEPVVTEPPTEPIVTEPPTQPPTEPVVTEPPTEPPTEPVVTEPPTQPPTEPVVTEPPTEPIVTEPPVVVEPPTEPIVTEPPTEPPIVTEPPTQPPTEPPTEPIVTEPPTPDITTTPEPVAVTTPNTITTTPDNVVTTPTQPNLNDGNSNPSTANTVTTPSETITTTQPNFNDGNSNPSTANTVTTPSETITTTQPNFNDGNSNPSTANTVATPPETITTTQPNLSETNSTSTPSTANTVTTPSETITTAQPNLNDGNSTPSTANTVTTPPETITTTQPNFNDGNSNPSTANTVTTPPETITTAQPNLNDGNSNPSTANTVTTVPETIATAQPNLNDGNSTPSTANTVATPPETITTTQPNLSQTNSTSNPSTANTVTTVPETITTTQPNLSQTNSTSNPSTVNNSSVELNSGASNVGISESDSVVNAPKTESITPEVTRSVLDPEVQQSVIPTQLIQAACRCYRSGTANDDEDCKDFKQFLEQYRQSQPVEITLKACGSGLLNFIIIPDDSTGNLPDLLTGGNQGNVTEIEIDETGKIRLKKSE